MRQVAARRRELALAARATAFPLDLVPLEDCRASLRKVVLREGVLLADAGVAEKGG